MTTSRPAGSPTRERSPLFSALIGVTALAVLLQGLWAGIFLEHDGKRNNAHSWIDVHAQGGYVATLLALAATVAAFLTLRGRRDLWLGSAALTVLLVLETVLGTLIRDSDKDVLTAVHIPLAMALMALVTWLSFQASHPG